MQNLLVLIDLPILNDKYLIFFIFHCCSFGVDVLDSNENCFKKYCYYLYLKVLCIMAPM